MGNNNTAKCFDDLFKEVYAGRTMWDYWSMPIDDLVKHAEFNEESAQVHKTRSSKLGKYLEGHD